MGKSLVSSRGMSLCVFVHVCIVWGEGTLYVGALHAWCDTICRKLMRKNVSRSAAAPPRFFALCVFAFTGSAVLRRLRHRHSGVILCNPNCMCFSFTQNNPKQLQGNSAQVHRQRAMSGSQWQDEERSFPALKHPLWDYNDNVLGSVLSPCLDPSASLQRNSILQYPIHSLGNTQFSIGYSVVL